MMTQIPFLWYVGAFAVALGVLIVVHELGHYLVARWVGVKVLRFSVGFGKPLFMRRLGRDQTEWALAAFPLGGYVKMLDEREGPVPAEELHRAFNRLSVGRRALVVVAGPVANLLLAILVYWVLFIGGVNELRPLLGAPVAGTPAAQAGIEDGDEVRQVSGTAVATLQDFHWQLIQRVADGEPIRLEVLTRRGEIEFRNLPAESLDASSLDGDLMQKLGISPYRPKFAPVIGMVAEGSVAQSAGLQAGDRVQSVDRVPIDSWDQLASAIRQSPQKPLILGVVRDGLSTEVTVVPQAVSEADHTIGRIGIGLGDQSKVREQMLIEVKLNPVNALARAVAKTWDTSAFTLRMIGRMLTGELSWRNISGPVTIADYAGQSARLGFDYYLKFLALI
ncbi:RIP metalloprotease RseP, partial [Azonexus sp.]|uniref:RIP metalloprotease RseP n=1 Tax=Azonexus sp. TaxID=1872668 RepID=UPI00281A579E